MRSLLWVEDSLIKELTLLNEVEEISQEQIKKIAKNFNDEVEMLGDNVDSNVLELRAKAQKAKEMYSKTVEEECEAIDQLWEKLDGIRSQAKQKLNQTVVEIQHIKSEVDRVNAAMDKIYQSDYKLEKTLDIIHRFANMSDTEKDMLVKLLNQ